MKGPDRAPSSFKLPAATGLVLLRHSGLELVRPLQDDGRSVSFAMIFAQNLVGGRTRQAPRTRESFQKPEHLKNLYLLMHDYIRRTEDIDRSNSGGYSPGLRDDAQEARDGIFSLLNAIPGKDAYVAIEEISRLHPDEASRAFMLQYALSKAQTDADLTPWSPQEVLAFNDCLERTPADHRSLAELVILRLLDMKDELEKGDTSLAEILRTKSLGETDVRLYFAREFREKSNGRYAAPQEEELADAKRPDIRIHGIGFDEPVPVELKLADKWSGAELFERLQNQLGGDYLRDLRSSRGVFLLVWRGEKKTWQVPGRTSAVPFDDLVKALQAYWVTISPRYPGVDELTVIGIDLTKRSYASDDPVQSG